MMKDRTETDKLHTYKSWRSFASHLLDEVGLKHAPQCFSNFRFILAILSGIVFLLVFHDFMPPFSSSVGSHWKIWVSLVIWQPLVEEILFRGILQGQLGKTSWGQRSWLHISLANVVTTILFITIHMVHSPPLFAIAVIVPSLIFGYFRDYCNSVYPSILLHSVFNAFVIEGLFIHGNIVKLPL